MIIPEFLKEGDCVALVSPAGCITEACLERGEKVLNRWKLSYKTGVNVMKTCGPCAGSDSERLADIQRALDDSEVKAIICTRGGYGSARIIDRLDFSKFLQKPKWITGFSDITVFHSHLVQNLGVASLHSCMPQTYPEYGTSDYAASVESLRKALFGEKPAYCFNSLPYNRAGRVEAPLVGGNLSMLYSLRGTPTDIDPAGKILFIEDIGEYDYHIDRMLLNLRRGGWFERIAGLVVGAFTQMKKGANPYSCELWELIKPYTEPYRYPVCFGFPAGHIPDNHALYMGVPAVLEVSDKVEAPSRLSF